MDYLLPLAPQTEAVFVRNTDVEVISWDVFYVPLTSKLWAAMALFTLAMSVSVRAIRICQREGLGYRKAGYQNGFVGLPSFLKEAGLVVRCYFRAACSFFGGSELSRPSDVSAM